MHAGIVRLTLLSGKVITAWQHCCHAVVSSRMIRTRIHGVIQFPKITLYAIEV